MNQLYASAISGPRGFGMRPREAWGPALGTGCGGSGDAHIGGSAAGIAGIGSAGGSGIAHVAGLASATSAAPIGAGGTSRIGALLGDGPAQGDAHMAMQLVDESFRQQVDVLKQALHHHRSVLAQHRSAQSSGVARHRSASTGF